MLSTRFDRDAQLLRENPALALGWPETLVKKLDRALRARLPTQVSLTPDEVALLLDHRDLDPEYHTAWFNHRGVQVVFRAGDKPAVWHL